MIWDEGIADNNVKHDLMLVETLLARSQIL